MSYLLDKARHIARDPALDEIVRLLLDYDPERIILFGSRARGEADEYSDYDLMVIKATTRPFLERLRDMVPYLVQFEHQADILVYTPEEFEQMSDVGFGWMVRQEGVTLYERSLAPPLSAVAPIMGGKQARRWFQQAQADLEVVRTLRAGNHYAAACFHAQQAAEKALKAVLYNQGARVVLSHAVQQLVRQCQSLDPAFAPLAADAGMLDQFYIPTRYPNGLPAPAVPSESYSEVQGEAAQQAAEQVIGVVEAYLRTHTDVLD